MNEVYECHGQELTLLLIIIILSYLRNIESWQCSKSCRQIYCSRSNMNFRFQFDKDTMLSPAIPTKEEKVKEEDSNKSSENKEGNNVDFVISNRPKCPQCDSPARPAILMFGDWKWTCDFSQREYYRAWSDSSIFIFRYRNIF